MLAFEVTSTWITFGPLRNVLSSIEGVASVKRHFIGDDRFSFSYLGERCVINEPWGDNSRYWIGPLNARASQVDMSPLRLAFQTYQSPIAALWRRLVTR